MKNHIPQTFNPQFPTVGINHQEQISPKDVQKLQEEMQQIKNLKQQMPSLLSSSSRSVIGSTSLANSVICNIQSFLPSLSSNTQKSSWFLDSRATNHMTPISNIFVLDEPCSIDKRELGKHLLVTDLPSLPTIYIYVLFHLRSCSITSDHCKATFRV